MLMKIEKLEDGCKWFVSKYDIVIITQCEPDRKKSKKILTKFFREIKNA